jgi:hypothetical protein
MVKPGKNGRYARFFMAGRRMSAKYVSQSRQRPRSSLLRSNGGEGGVSRKHCFLAARAGEPCRASTGPGTMRSMVEG